MTKLEQYEKQHGRPPTPIKAWHEAVKKLRDDPGGLTDHELVVIDHYGGSTAAAEARAAREAVLHPAPPPPPPAPRAEVPPAPQYVTVKRIVRDGQDRITGVIEDLVPVTPGGVAAAPSAFEARLDAAVKAQDVARETVIAQVNQAFVSLEQRLYAVRDRVTELEAQVDGLRRERQQP